jgi:single-strand DNA-binding protein
MTEASVSLAGNLTEDPRSAIPRPRAGSLRAVLRVAVSGRREQEASFFTVIVWRDQAEHAVESLSRGSRVVVVGRLQQRSWTDQDDSARSVVEVLAEELGPSLRWATATPSRARRVRKRVHAARRYSWSRPPSRSRRYTLLTSSSATIVSPVAGSGAWSCSPRCARCRL